MAESKTGRRAAESDDVLRNKRQSRAWSRHVLSRSSHTSLEEQTTPPRTKTRCFCCFRSCTRILPYLFRSHRMAVHDTHHYCCVNRSVAGRWLTTSGLFYFRNQRAFARRSVEATAAMMGHKRRQTTQRLRGVGESRNGRCWLVHHSIDLGMNDPTSRTTRAARV